MTLADIASHAGLSRTTVSYVLSGRSEAMRISSETQERVRSIAAQLNYRPNQSARSLRTSKSTTIGFISDFVASGPFASQMIAGASRAAISRGHAMLIAETERDTATEMFLVEELLQRQVDAFVYVTLEHRRCDVPTAIRDHPYVLLNCVDETARAPWIVPDEFSGGATAARALLDAGCSGEVAVVGDPGGVDVLPGPLRLSGIRSECASSVIDLQPILPCAWDAIEAFSMVDELLNRGHRPSGLICMNDRVALGVYQALERHALRAGTDVSVVSFDGSELAMWLCPSLTSVALPFAELGAAAVDLLLGDGPLTAGPHLVPMQIQHGDSIVESRAV